MQLIAVIIASVAAMAAAQDLPSTTAAVVLTTAAPIVDDYKSTYTSKDVVYSTLDGYGAAAGCEDAAAPKSCGDYCV
ncbi:hypothetical protein HDU67_001727, partial [Dinochytrium kinnereticum]